MTGGSDARTGSTGLSALPDAYHKHRRVTMTAGRAVSTPGPRWPGITAPMVNTRRAGCRQASRAI